MRTNGRFYIYINFAVYHTKNGKVAKVPLKEYETKTNRKKLQKAYSGKSPLVAVLYSEDNCDIVLSASNGKAKGNSALSYEPDEKEIKLNP